MTLVVSDSDNLEGNVTECSTFTSNDEKQNVTCPEEVTGRYLYLIQAGGESGRLGTREVRLFGETVGKK